MKKHLSALLIAGAISLSATNLFAEEAHPVKMSTTVFGSPDILESSIDPIWDEAEPINTFRAKKGEITDETSFPIVKTMWDKNYLYILAEIEDSTIFKNTDPKALHESDCTEYYFNPLKDRENNTYDDSEFWIKIYPDGTLESHQNAPEGIEATAFLTKVGYVTQVKVPHTNYNAMGEITVGFDLQINNASKETGKRDLILGWNDMINVAYKDPSVVGELLFEPEPNPIIARPTMEYETLIPAVNQNVKVTPDGHIIKTINAIYGNPLIESDSSTVDPIWNTVVAATDFHVKRGDKVTPSSIKTMWNEEYFYVLAEVTDIEIFKHETMIHESDNTELHIDLDLSRAATYDEGDFWLKIFPDGFAQNQGEIPEGTITNAIITETGYITQYKIPYAAIAGERIGFDIQINDADKATGQRHNSSGWNDTTPDTWKTLANVGELYFMPPVQNTAVKYIPVVSMSVAELSTGEEHQVKNIEVGYGSPADFTSVANLDPAWENATRISDFHSKKGETTESSSVDILWDEEYIYLLGIIEDDEIYKNINPTALHESDYLEVYFNPLIDRSNGKYDQEEFWIKIHPDGTLEKHANAPEGIVNFAEVTETGYVVGAKVPHSFYDASSGTTIGFDLQIGDANQITMKRDSIVGWNDTINSAWKNPDVVGTLTLLEKGAIPKNAEIQAIAANVKYVPIVTTTETKISTGEDLVVKNLEIKYGYPAEFTSIEELDPAWADSTLMNDFFDKKETDVESKPATLNFLWSEDYLHVLAQVEDDEIYKNPEKLYESDYVEIYFNPLVDRSNGTYDKEEFWIKIHPDGLLETHANAPEGIINHGQITENGYVVEARIPHSFYEAKSGTTIGLDLQIGNASAATTVRDTVIGWNDTIGTAWKNPDVVGTLTLLGEGEIPKNAVIQMPVTNYRPIVTTTETKISTGEDLVVKNLEIKYGSPAEFTSIENLDPIWNSSTLMNDFFNKKDINVVAKPATLNFLWDEKYLHVLAQVEDDEIYKNPEKLYESDYVEMYFNPLVDRSNGTYDKEEFWIKIYPDGLLETHANAPDGIINHGQVTENGYVVTASIPHTFYEAKSGTTLGLDLQIGNASSATMDRDTVIGWNDTIGTAWKNPDVVGTLTLLGEGEIPKNAVAIQGDQEIIISTPREPIGPIVIPEPVVTVLDRQISSGQVIPVKHTTVVYGRPKITESSTSLDPIWETATVLNELRAKRGAINENTDMAEVRLLWDEDYLYVAGIIEDSEIFRKDESPGDSDNLELFFNPLVDRSNGKYDSEEYWLKIYPNGEIENHANLPEGVVASAYLTKTGYVAQAKIPHSEYRAEAGTTIGFDFQVNNGSKDINTRHTILGWNDPLNAAYANPDVLGELTLMGRRGEFGNYVPPITVEKEIIPLTFLDPSLLIEILPDPIAYSEMPEFNFDENETKNWQVNGTENTKSSIVTVNGDRAVRIEMNKRQTDGVGISTLMLAPEQNAWSLGSDSNSISAKIINPSQQPIQVRMKVTDYFGNEKMNYITVNPSDIEMMEAELGEAGVFDSSWGQYEGHSGKGIDKTQITKIEFFIPEDMLDVMPGIESAEFIIDAVKATK